MNTNLSAAIEMVKYFNDQIEQTQTTGERFTLTVTTNGEDFTIHYMGLELYNSTDFVSDLDPKTFFFNMEQCVRLAIRDIKLSLRDVKLKPMNFLKR